jgi:formate-dependent nitrite reductase membrane component NrfD
MFEIDTTRHNPGVDPVLHVWGWEIPVYLFVGGMVAGMMILAGIAMLRVAKGEDPRKFFSIQTPLLGFMLLNVGMLALLLDLAHPLYVWAVYLTFEPLSPMSWGSWVLLIVYGVLLVSALIRLPDAWPWLGRKLPVLQRISDAMVANPALLRMLGWASILLGVILGIYTGILLNTMVARPLWNSAILGPLFLVSGLSAAAAMVHLATRIFPGRPAPQGMIGGAFASMVQNLGPQPPEKRTVDSLIRADLAFLAIELLLIALLVISLLTSSASHAEAAKLILGGSYTMIFWLGVVTVGIVVPLALQALELGHRIPHTVLPAVLVLAGGFALRWVMVNAGQASTFIQAAAR